MRTAVALVLVASSVTGCRLLTEPATVSAPPPAVSTPTCTNASVVATWPVARRAAALVAVPTLDFDMAAVVPEVRAGAGGVLVLGHASAPADLAVRIQSLRGNAGVRGLPLVMADEEGGGISRLAGVVDYLPWARTMAATMTPSQVRATGARVGRQMRAAGVDVDLAPVLDVDAGDGPSDVNADGKRSFSGNATTAATYGTAFMNGLRDGGVLPVVKHFPGLGGTYGNTDDRAASTPSIATLRRVGLVPFETAIAAGAPAVMIANASIPGLTPLPASLSRATITGLLRTTLRFHGLVMTDSLSAGAVRQVTTSIADASVRAIEAGADMVLYGTALRTGETEAQRAAAVATTFNQIVDAIVQAVTRHAITVTSLNASVLRVLAAKQIQLC